MARTRFRRPSGVRKERQWILSQGDSVSVDATGPFILDDLTADYEAEIGMSPNNLSVLAIHGSIGAFAGATPPTSVGRTAFGIAWVPEGLVTKAELPDPLDDDYDWFFHRLWVNGRGLAANDPVWKDPGGAIPYSNKTGRKQRENHSKLVAIISTSANQTITCQTSNRVLYALP